MAVPQSCKVLIVGGGPAGSYAACCLAREGVDTVVLEAEKFPRYHIGESTLPSLRHFLQFIDCDDKFDNYGFYKKIGAVFRLNQAKPDAHTDFIAAGGPNSYAWNLLRSESDDLLFRHAGSCGAHIFDETKVDTIRWDAKNEAGESISAGDHAHLGRPVAATWKRKDGASGEITFDYLIDASGRQGLVSTKYMKSRTFNKNFQNVANWAYWKTDNIYGRGTHMETAPYFEGLKDASGWCWFMPLHDGTRSVGIVQDQKLATQKKRAMGNASTRDFYESTVAMSPGIANLLEGAELVTDVKSASDYSYTSSTYHLPYTRLCGDAGCFIDPLFSSGVHLAITSGLSAAVTVMASLRKELDENEAGDWHSKKTVESYTRFFLAVGSATKQIRTQAEPDLRDMDNEGFQRAFDLLQPIIQGTSDTKAATEITQSNVSEILEFCFKAFNFVQPEEKDALFAKLAKLREQSGPDGKTVDALDNLEEISKHLTPDELQIVETLRSRRMVREDLFDIEAFTLNTIDGFAPRLERGKLGLEKTKAATLDKSQFFSPAFLDGKMPGIREGTGHTIQV